MNKTYTLSYGSPAVGFGEESFDRIGEAQKAFWKMVDSRRFDHVTLMNNFTGEVLLLNDLIDESGDI